MKTPIAAAPAAPAPAIAAALAGSTPPIAFPDLHERNAGPRGRADALDEREDGGIGAAAAVGDEAQCRPRERHGLTSSCRGGSRRRAATTSASSTRPAIAVTPPTPDTAPRRYGLWRNP